MSTNHYFNVECDVCGEPLEATQDGVRAARKLAKDKGWKLTREMDLCPKCILLSKELTEKLA